MGNSSLLRGSLGISMAPPDSTVDSNLAEKEENFKANTEFNFSFCCDEFWLKLNVEQSWNYHLIENILYMSTI